MAIKERIREPISGLIRPDYLEERIKAGWRLVGLEWERETAEEPSAAGEWVEEIPYGLRVSDDGMRLVGNPVEIEVIVRALDLIVEDCPLSRVADRLNERGLRTREGDAWTAPALFQLLPRMIQVGPRLFSTEEWLTRRARLPHPAL
ncbi:MAG TPA: recombinase family protein [Bryobacteraceae bacterium]|nr:recombinase family protein [Bryobacteraceae bacterium]